MNISQIIKKVLDWEFARIPAQSDSDKIKLINQRHNELKYAYNDLTDHHRAAPDYADPVTRFAYIYKYTTCHADIVRTSIESYSELSQLFDGADWLRIACIGGGPGSDFLGVMKYAIRHRKQRSLKCFLLDQESAWGDTWSDIEEHTDDLTFRLSTHFQSLDVTVPTTWQGQTRYLSAHLFTFIYFLSEIYRKDSLSKGFFAKLVNDAQPGAYFLFVDNDAASFRTQIQRFSTEFRLRVINNGSLDYQTEFSEDKKDLNPYFEWLSDWPKIKAKIYQALMVKE